MDIIRLTDKDKIMLNGHNSKGVQEKFKININNIDYWCKLDARGYEGLAEAVASNILYFSNIESFVPYSVKQFYYNGKIYNGCISENFLPSECNLITVDNLYKTYYGKDVLSVCKRKTLLDTIETFVKDTASLTGIDEEELGRYFTSRVEFDAFVLNDDLHFNNIAFIEHSGSFIPAPFFDNGSGLLSDQIFYWGENALDYKKIIQKVEAKPFSKDFTEQKEAFENLYGKYFTLPKDLSVNDFLPQNIQIYDTEIIRRISFVLQNQYNKYLGLNEIQYEEDEPEI
ncbi:MAG: hypothetical protein MR409_10690 [Lachnospiraceae bacterium]|nr:hypothetical protein [Lachnospiraceae bacterium]